MLSTQEVTFYNEELYFGLGGSNDQTITMLNNETALSSTSSMVMSEQLRSPPPSRFGSALGASVAFIFIVFGMLGDTLIIAAILSKRELRNNMVNIFIVSLQLNDLFNIGFNQFLVGLGYLFMKWHVPYIVCEMVVYTSIICTGTLLWHHALIAIHRYLVVVCNLNINHFKRAPKFYALFSVIIARLIPTLVCAPALYSRHMTVYSPAALRCMLAPGVSGLQNLLIVLLLILAPCIVVLFCFANIFARVRTVSKNVKLGSGYVSVSSGGGGGSGGLTVGGGVSAKSSVSVNGGGLKPLTTQLAQEIIMSHSAAAAANKQSSVTITDKAIKSRHNSPSNYTSAFSMSLASMHREIQISKMFAIIFTVFLFGYLPYGIIRLIDSKNSLNPDVYVMLTVLFIISISISPIIYGLMNKQIKMQCKLLLTRLFGCCFCRNGEVADEKATFMTKSRHGQNKQPINHFAVQRSPPQTTRHQAVSPKDSDQESGSSEKDHNNNKIEQKDRTCEKNGSPTKAQNPLISSSLPQLNAAANDASSNPYCPKECHSLMNTTNVVKEEKSGRRVRSSMSKHFFNLFTKSSSLKKQPPTVNSSGDVEKTSLPTSPHENKTQPDEVGESLTQSKLLILAEDDGGVYKGPTID